MKIFVERPIATAMLFLVLMILGIYSFLNIPFELAPKQEFPQLDIQAGWPGVPPEIIQTQITAPLEEIASTVKGVRKMTSISLVGQSRITLEFEPKTNMEFARLALQERIAELRDVLPYGIRPRVEPYIPPIFVYRPLLSYTISGNYSLQKLRELVKEKIEIGIGSVKGISQVSVRGGSDPEIRIILDEKKLRSLDIRPYRISYAITNRTRTYPAGKIKKRNQEFIFKVSDPIKGLWELGETVIARSGDNSIKLKDIAQIVPSFGDIYFIERINGQPTIRLTIRKERGASTPKVARAVKKRLEAIKAELPRDLVFRGVDDQSGEIQKSLQEIYLLIGIIISVIFILIFVVLRNFKPSLLVLSSIVFSVLITFNLIYLFRISINMLTLGGLALGFGLFVDNSIVVFENVLRLKEKGMSALQAAIKGPKEVFLPVLAATLTTMSVFFSFAYFQGRMKIYYLPLAIVISSALAASLLVSFSLIPAMCPKLLKRRRKGRKERFRGSYEKVLKVLLRHPGIVILITAIIFFLSYTWFRKEVSMFEWFGWTPRQELSVRITTPPGTPIEKTDEIAGKFENKVLEKKYEKEMNTSMSAERASLRIKFPPHIEYSHRPYVLREEMIQLATNFAGIGIGISGFDPQGYYSGLGGFTYLGSRIKFFGYNLKKLSDITRNLERTLLRNPRIKRVSISSGRYGRYTDYFEYILRVDREAMRKYDINPDYLYSHISAFLPGRVSIPLKGKIGGRELDISMKFPEAARMDLKSLQDMLIQTQRGEFLKLGEITTLEERPIAGSIDREDQQFQQIVSWEFRGPSKAAEKYREDVYSKLDLPPGFSATLDWFGRLMTTEEKGQIKFAIIISLIIIFMILASLYESLIQPFFILLAVPLALIGVFIAFVLADFPFDSSAFIGVILLGGIVVNNSILLVDHINLKRREGLPLLDAVLKGARERIRPIFLTTSTTVLGMLPLVLLQIEVERRRIWSSLALSAVGGLISSTIFILIVIPIFYYHGDNIRSWVDGKVNETRKVWQNLFG
ncbi:MAG: efflux RND transporter permease subunit [Candidatus Aminicenantaceae bacterium]